MAGVSTESSLSAQPRPNFVHRESDNILSYYQSEHAGRSYNAQDFEEYRSELRDGDSSGSNTPSEYSDEDEVSQTGKVMEMEYQGESFDNGNNSNTSSHRRRPSVPSEGGSDRRRLAIVEMDTDSPLSIPLKRSGIFHGSESDQSFSPSSNLLSRRGLHVNGLALVAPPDASPKTYTNLTPPPSAPVVAAQVAEHSSSHHRSASDTTQPPHIRLNHKSSRDVGIVGTGGMYSIPERSATVHHEQYDSLKTPIFQTPSKSRSPSPGMHTPDLSLSDSSTPFAEHYHATPQTAVFVSPGLLTPGIGEGKDIRQPVVGPVVVGLESDEVLRRYSPHPPSSTTSRHAPSVRSNSTSPYVHYKPGVDSTAGPLPPPPKSIFEPAGSTAPPPRPPRLRTPLSVQPTNTRRDIEALKESLQLPPSVSAVLSSRASSRTQLTRNDSYDSAASRETEEDRVSTTQRSRSIHRREGAFPPSTSTSIDQSPSVEKQDVSIQPKSELRNKDYPQIPLQESDSNGQSRLPEVEIRRERSQMSIRSLTQRDRSPESRPSSVDRRRSFSRSPSDLQSPLPPPKPTKTDDNRGAASGSNNSLKATLMTNLKRFSALPKTPSYPSLASVAAEYRDSRTPSPAAIPRRLSPHPRIKSSNPPALQFNDVLSQRSALERSKGYANKINELAMYDSGLSEWILAMKARGSSSRTSYSKSNTLVGVSSLPSVLAHHPQPRHTSHGSMASEATFPIRPDAYTATDLSIRPIDDLSSTKSPPPSLPYPSLATTSRTTSVRSTSTIFSVTSQRYQLPTPVSGKSGGFFSSLGRKTSTKKNGSPSAPNKVLTKRSSNTSSETHILTRPLGPPSIPGGPRAAPGRMQRAQTISISPPMPVAPSAPEPVSRRATQRLSKPSLFNRSTATTTMTPAQTPEFEHQVDRLADLLPHADRTVLAGYLRRAGQDILAIGQYLEDEKNGTIRRD
ncbi:hypothetical protein C8Q75DRAFT_808397 [Abortiporus biennis]|nr:hypothetical protein C8Q75DRAFT_808397 [Abortiporus biennis]